MYVSIFMSHVSNFKRINTHTHTMFSSRSSLHFVLILERHQNNNEIIILQCEKRAKKKKKNTLEIIIPSVMACGGGRWERYEKWRNDSNEPNDFVSLLHWRLISCRFRYMYKHWKSDQFRFIEHLMQAYPFGSVEVHQIRSYGMNETNAHHHIDSNQNIIIYY